MDILTLRDIMTWPVATTTPDRPARAALDAMRERRISALVVVEGERPVGIFTERDAVLLAYHHQDADAVTVGEVMGQPPLTATPETEYRHAYQLISDRGVRHLIVVDADGRLAGIVSEANFLDHLGYEYLVRFKEVGAVMTRRVLTVPEDAVAEEAVRLMARQGISCVVAERDGKPVGVLTERDMVRLARDKADTAALPLAAVMSAPVQLVSANDPLDLAIRRMNESDVRRLVVVDAAGRIAGLVTRHDLTKVLYSRHIEHLRETIAQLRQELARQPDKLFRHLVDHSADAVLIADARDGRVQEANERACELLGYGRDELLAKRVEEFAAPVAEAGWPQRVGWLKGQGSALVQTENRRKDGSWVPVEVALRYVEGEPHDYVIAIVRDDSRRRQAEAGLRLAASVFESSREGITITDTAANIIDVNDAFCQITGYGRDEAIGRNPRLLKSGRHDAAFYQAMWQALLERGYWSGEIWNRRKSGEVYPELLTITSVRDEAGTTTHYVGVFTDITVLKQHERQLEHIAHYDALTGIPNRVLLADRMQQAIAQTRRDGKFMAVGYLDLDGFKPINDKFGHEAGDRVLVEIARRLKATLRGTDTVARLGGDEFVFLLLSVDKVEECAATLGRVLEAITQPMALAGQSISISASIGVTLHPLDDADPDTLLRHADQAMYQAKQNGRNRYHLYDPEHDRRAQSHREAFARIQQALAAGEFELHYQPKVDMRRGRVVGAEALIRWRHPTYGLMPPGEFLPIIENSALDAAIGDWVLRTALADLQGWQAGGRDLQISINVSAHHLQREDFVQRLAELLAAHPAVPPGRLQLEVLETAALEDMAGVSDIMRRCRAQGVGFALDDFGTGYSSLTYLKRLPAETLKIDQSFIRDILEDPEDLAIVEGVIALTRAFGRTAVAEGVETVEQGLQLLRLGCELAQGYGIAKPMPAAELAGWMDSWRPDPRWLAD